MIHVDNWAAKLFDRLLNSPGEEPMIVGPSPIEVGGEPHILGLRITETCALAGREVKRGSDLFIALPPPDALDVLMTVLYLHFLRQAVLAGRSTPGRWATPEALQGRRDVWLVGNVSQLRDTVLERLIFEGRSLAKKFRLSWCAQRAGKVVIETVGEGSLPGICLFGATDVKEGTLAQAMERELPPFAVFVDAAGVDHSRELAAHVSRLRKASQGAPIILLGALGDRATLDAVHDAQIQVFVLRAGDAARLTKLEIGAAFTARRGGADLASSRLIDGIRVEVSVLPALAMRELVSPLLKAAQQMERVAADEKTLVSRARNLVRAVLGMCVPWKLLTDAVAARGRPGRFATQTLEARLKSLRESQTSTGEAALALEQLVMQPGQIFRVLREPACLTGKQEALREEARAAQIARRALYVVCANETTQQAVQTFLGEQVEVIGGCVRVVTRSQLRRAIAAGTSNPAELLLLSPLGYSDGFYFSGVASVVRVHVYDFERPALERQLRSIARDTQCTSAGYGDKRAFVVGTTAAPGNRRSMDWDLEDAPPLWRVQHTGLGEMGVLPRQRPEVEPFIPPDYDWLQTAPEERDESADEDSDPVNEQQEAGASVKARAHVLIELSDEEQAAVLSPEASIVVLDDQLESDAGAILAREARAGMTVLLARRPLAGDLMDRLLERFEDSAHYFIAKQFRQMWRDGLSILFQQTDGSVVSAFAQLAQHGVGVTTSGAVRSWIRGLVLGPRDLESIQALGHATSRSELILHYDKIFRAIDYIRQLHIALKRKLFEYARAGDFLGPADELIDERLRLRRADLRALTRIGRITKVTHVAPGG